MRPDSAVPGDIVSIRGEPIPSGATLDEVLRHPDAFERAQRVAQILQRSGPEDLEQLKRTFENASLERGDLEYGLFGHWWARFDPKAAFSYCDNHVPFEHGGVLLQVVRAWAGQDPIGAIESQLLVGRESQTPGMRDELTDVFVVGWFESGLPGLEDWMVSQNDPGAIANALRAYGRMIILRDGAEPALEWSRTAPFEQADRRLIVAGMLNVIAHEDPELAVKWLKIAEDDGVDVRTFVSRIAHSWAHHDPQKSLEWVLEMAPEGPQRDQAIWAVGRRWVRKDEPGLEKWLESRGGEPWENSLRNQALRTHLKRNFYHVDWNELMDRAFTITDEQQAQGAATWLLQRWRVAHQEEAEAWVASHPDALTEKQLGRTYGLAPHDREEIEAALARQSPG